MKICYAAPANSVHSFRWIRYFVELGCDVHWISMVPPTLELPRGVKFYLIDRGRLMPFNYIRVAIEMRRLIQKINPDVLHVHSVAAYGLAALSGVRPIVATAWGSDVLFCGESFVRKWVVQRVLRNAACITCDANHMKSAMAALGAEPDKIKLIYFGVDVERYSKGERDGDLRQKLGIADNPAVLSMRNLLKVYNIETLINAAPALVKAVPGAKIVILGSGPEEEDLKRLARERGVENDVLFVGSVASEDLPAYMSTMDVYVSTSLSDAGLAASTQEAMACEMTVVVSDIGENDEWVDGTSTGYLFPAKDHKALADRLIDALNESKEHDSIGKRAREVILKRSNYFVEMDKMNSIYEQLAGVGGSGK